MKHSLKPILPSIPSSLLLLRFVLGPSLLVIAFDCKEGHRDTPFGCPWFLIGFTAAFLSDVFDGIIARRLKVDTEKLREYDGWVDTWFYCWILVSAWILHFDALFALRIPLLLVVSTQLISWVIDWAKFRRFTSYHAYSSKAWGVTLFVAFIALFGFDYAGITLWLAIIVGILSHIEEMAMTLTLPRWMHDVPSIVHALRIRHEAASQSTKFPPS